jgi:hypothetical protein
VGTGDSGCVPSGGDGDSHPSDYRAWVPRVENQGAQTAPDATSGNARGHRAIAESSNRNGVRQGGHLRRTLSVGRGAEFLQVFVVLVFSAERGRAQASRVLRPAMRSCTTPAHVARSIVDGSCGVWPARDLRVTLPARPRRVVGAVHVGAEHGLHSRRCIGPSPTRNYRPTAATRAAATAECGCPAHRPRAGFPESGGSVIRASSAPAQRIGRALT